MLNIIKHVIQPPFWRGWRCGIYTYPKACWYQSLSYSLKLGAFFWPTMWAFLPCTHLYLSFVRWFDSNTQSWSYAVIRPCVANCCRMHIKHILVPFFLFQNWSAKKKVYKLADRQWKKKSEVKSLETQWVFFLHSIEEIQTLCLRRLLTDWILQRLNEKILLSIGEKWAVRNDKLSDTSVILTGPREEWREEEGKTVKRQWNSVFSWIHHCWENANFPLDSDIVNEVMMISCCKRK